MRSTHDHEDRVRYWLTDAVGHELTEIKSLLLFYKIIRNFLHKDWHIHNSKDLLIISETIIAFIIAPHWG